MALLGAPSRFAVLKVDVSDPRERKKPQQQQQQQQAQQANKNNKQQQQPQQQKNNKKKKDNNNNNKKKGAAAASGVQQEKELEKFDEWRKRDEELMAEMYEKELQEALMRSRIEQENKEQHSPGFGPPDLGAARGGAKPKKTLSLAEFHEKFYEESTPAPPVRGEPLSKLLAQRKQAEEGEQALRRASQREAESILAREKVQEEMREKADQPRVVAQEEFDRMLEMKKKQIEHMARLLSQTNKDNEVLQEQNKDLEALVAKGEMKKKVELMREVEQLRQVRDELTDQMQTLYAALEQERSKVHQLTQELHASRASKQR